jgi:hypothetical protein
MGGGCCSAGADGVCLDRPEAAHSDSSDTVFAATYRLLRERLPEADVQIAASSNTIFLVPSSYRAARRNNHNRFESFRRAMASTTAGTVLVDGEILGDIESMGADAVLGKVLASASR